MSRVLDVYLKGYFVGTLTQETSGQLSFAYDHAYVDEKRLPVSLSLPLRKEPYDTSQVKAFFSGLLPDEEVRKRLAQNLGLSEKNPFALLEAVGGDCAGALAFYPQGEKPEEATEEVENLSPERLYDILKLINRRPMLAGDGGYRLSLAGAQDKLAVGYKNGQIQLMKGGAPTTHILKPMIKHIKDSAHNEFFCMRLAFHMWLSVPKVSLHFAGEIPYCLIARYDRAIDDKGQVIRIHQEDFCQALGIPPELKYEREGGPTIKRCQEIMTKNAESPALAQLKLFKIILFNYLIGNNDAHGKNFSLLYSEKKPSLAPPYDLLSTAIYPNLATEMAMKIGGEYDPENIYRRHFYRLVDDTKTARVLVDYYIELYIKRIVYAAETLKKN